MSKKVLVLMGGFSSEREVSLVSGKGAANALKQKNYEVIEHDLTDTYSFIETLKKEKPDVVFNALHGTFGEDGAIPGLLDLLQIPYTHSSTKTSAIAMDKIITKKIAKNIGIPTPKFALYKYEELLTQTKFSYPYIIKPVEEGSSVGIYIIKSKSDLDAVKDKKRDYLAEDFISGKELTVSVLNDKALTVTELIPNVEFYDYEAKYTDGITTHELPAKIPHDIFDQALRHSLNIHKELQCNCVSRSDFRYNEKDGLQFLEINTHPGLTPLSLVPEQAKYCNISYEELCDILVNNAICKKA